MVEPEFIHPFLKGFLICWYLPDSQIRSPAEVAVRLPVGLNNPVNFGIQGEYFHGFKIRNYLANI